MMDELADFINEVYRWPYSLIGNNCISKSLRIKNKDKELGKRADLVGCISIVPIRKWHNFPTINPHFYTEVDGKKVDVSLDPGHEEIYCKNSEKKLIMPVNISKIGRILSRIVRPKVINQEKLRKFT